jgi:hypothetical protein
MIGLAWAGGNLLQFRQSRRLLDVLQVKLETLQQ